MRKDKYCKSMEADCKLQVWDALLWQQKFWTRYLDLWRSYVFNVKLWEESEERKQYMNMKFEVVLVWIQMSTLWQKL